MQSVLDHVFTAMDLSPEHGLITRSIMQDPDLDCISPRELFLFTQAHNRLHVDAVYFSTVPDGEIGTPAIYFYYMEEYSPCKAAEIHCLTWNAGSAPLLFIVTKTSIAIYSNYEPPGKTDGMFDVEAGLIENISLASSSEELRIQLSSYHRMEFESGNYWRNVHARFNPATRVDKTLISNLLAMREELISHLRDRFIDPDTNIESIINGLLTRSVLIQYLEGQNDEKLESVFPRGLFSEFLPGACSYTDILVSKEATYKLYRFLENKFGGDIFPLAEEEYDLICEEDLLLLRDFLLGKTGLENSQLSLWPLYSFDVIPSRLIREVYEYFYHLMDNSSRTGTDYTPFFLVDLLMDEVYPWDGDNSDVTFLDPACGSGIFLAEAFRRRVFRWTQANRGLPVTCGILTDLLEQSIFGIDINSEAIRVTLLSLILAMCEFLSPSIIWESLSFPKLIGKTLFVADFFSDPFQNRKFDIVIGNPPWQSELTAPAQTYLKETGETVGDNQIAQAFALKSARVCAPNGQVCLIMPCKSLLFNRSGNTIKFRQTLFQHNRVISIINFSAVRQFLFSHAVSPAASIIFSPDAADPSLPILYCTPKPTYTIEDSRRITIEPCDVINISPSYVDNDQIWKIAMLGNQRDFALIEKMNFYGLPLHQFASLHSLTYGEGYLRGNRSNDLPGFQGLPDISPKDIADIYFDSSGLSRICDTRFQRYASRSPDIFEAPHLLIRQSPQGTKFLSAVLDYDAVFSHSILGIHGDASILKYLCLIIGSNLFSYYHLMTNRRWLVERSELEAADILSTPVPAPTDELLRRASELFDDLKKGGDPARREQFVQDIFHFHPLEMVYINDTIKYVCDFYYKKGRSIAIQPVSRSQLSSYSETLEYILRLDYKKTVTGSVAYYIGRAPLVIVSLSFNTSSSSAVWIDDDAVINQAIAELDALLTTKKQSLASRRILRLYNADSVFLIKPKQARYWTCSAACHDADEIFGDIERARGAFS